MNTLRKYKHRYWTELTARAHKLGDQGIAQVQEIHGCHDEFWFAWREVQAEIALEDAKTYEEKWG